MMVTQRYIRLQDWARQYGMSRITAWRLYNEDRLPPELRAHKVGGVIYVLANPNPEQNDSHAEA